MKKLLFLLIVTGIFSGHKVFSQIEDNITFELRGRPAGQTAVMSITDATNMTTFPVYFTPDYTTGNEYVLELHQNGRFVYGKSFIVSNQLINDITRHRSNPATAESINQICMTQATAMQDVFRKGLELERQILSQLAEQANKKSPDSCNCPDNPDLQENWDRRVAGNIDGLGDGKIYYMSDDNLRKLPDYEKIIVNPTVKKTWFGKNWWWVVSTALIKGYILADGLSDGEWWEWFDDPFTSTQTIIVYTNPNDPNDPNYDPNHNGNGRFFGGGIERPLVNNALDSWAQPHRGGGIISFPIFGGRAP